MTFPEIEHRSRPEMALRDYRYFLPGLLIVVALVGVVVRYAGALNAEYYRTNAPFFDSASYTNKLATVCDITHKYGAREGISEALSGTTAPLPDLEAVLLVKLHLLGPHPNRLSAVHLQATWLVLLGVTLFVYLYRFVQCDQWLSAALTAPFLLFSQMFSFNGGISDFRLDLALYIFVSITLVFYLIAEET